MIVRTLLKSKTSNEVSTTTADQSVDGAARLLHQKRIGAVVVVDSAHRIAGILSERDIARGIALHGEAVHRLSVGDLMTSAVLVCSPEDSLEKLMEVMTRHRVRHLPVVERDGLVGMISIGDVVKARLEDATLQVDSLREYVMAAR
jgi:CBS domain-containing protein